MRDREREQAWSSGTPVPLIPPKRFKGKLSWAPPAPGMCWGGPRPPCHRPTIQVGPYFGVSCPAGFCSKSLHLLQHFPGGVPGSDPPPTALIPKIFLVRYSQSWLHSSLRSPLHSASPACPQIPLLSPPAPAVRSGNDQSELHGKGEFFPEAL